MSPRWRRTFQILLQGPATTMEIAVGAGVCGVTAMIHAMRCKGLSLPCRSITVLNRDRETCHPGQYSLTEADRDKVLAWLSQK